MALVCRYCKKPRSLFGLHHHCHAAHRKIDTHYDHEFEDDGVKPVLSDGVVLGGVLSDYTGPSFSGNGGTFGGAGATGSWDDSGSSAGASVTTNPVDTAVADSSPTPDFSSFDSGSSSFDSGSSSSF